MKSGAMTKAGSFAGKAHLLACTYSMHVIKDSLYHFNLTAGDLQTDCIHGRDGIRVKDETRAEGRLITGRQAIGKGAARKGAAAKALARRRK